MHAHVWGGEYFEHCSVIKGYTETQVGHDRLDGVEV